jgi:hypothetical protein
MTNTFTKVKESFEILTNNGLWDENLVVLKRNFYKFSLENHPDKSPQNSDIFANVSSAMDICLENLDIIHKEFIQKNDIILDNLLCFKCNGKRHETEYCPIYRERFLKTLLKKA